MLAVHTLMCGFNIAAHSCAKYTKRLWPQFAQLGTYSDESVVEPKDCSNAEHVLFLFAAATGKFVSYVQLKERNISYTWEILELTAPYFILTAACTDTCSISGKPPLHTGA